MIRRLVIVCLFLFLNCFSVSAEELVKLDVSTNLNNNKLEVLIKFDILDGWHIFAPYKQELGEPLNIKWKHLRDHQIIEESYSRTQRFHQDDFSFDGYEKVAFYKSTIELKNDTREIEVDIRWQACADECIPESRTIKIPTDNTANFKDKLKQASEYFTAKEYSQKINYITIFIMAFMGGIILNLMPCIFPILSIKLIALSQINKNTRKKEALLYGIGVISSMMIISGLLYIARLSDQLLSWGFQLQSPWFVALLLLVFIVVSLLMLDIVNFNSGWLNSIACFRIKNNKLNAFMTGLLAVLVATPCTAPFMGAAVGYALMSSTYVYIPVFFFLGLGYALPFVLIAWHPSFICNILPKPGKWMVILKRIMSIPLILTCIWLSWLLMIQLGLITSGKNLQWQEYTTLKVNQALEEKRPVFIDFTAKWCITCLVNKKTALQSDKLAELVKEKNILLLRADITNHSETIAKGLQSYGRASVPLYVYYDGKSDDYLILPQLLTPAILDEYLM